MNRACIFVGLTLLTPGNAFANGMGFEFLFWQGIALALLAIGGCATGAWLAIKKKNSVIDVLFSALKWAVVIAVVDSILAMIWFEKPLLNFGITLIILIIASTIARDSEVSKKQRISISYESDDSLDKGKASRSKKNETDSLVWPLFYTFLASLFLNRDFDDTNYNAELIGAFIGFIYTLRMAIETKKSWIKSILMGLAGAVVFSLVATFFIFSIRMVKFFTGY